MSMGNKRYLAEFPDGQKVERRTHRVYALAWRVKLPCPFSGRELERHGFSGSLELARQSARRAVAGDGGQVEIVPAVKVEETR